MQEAALFESARTRTELPEEYVSLDYRKETNLLAIRYSYKKRAYSRADLPKGIIYDYDYKDNLVQVEILDFYAAAPGRVDDELNAQVKVEGEIKKVERAARRKKRTRKIARQCCKECGQPKHYICLEHNSQIKLKIKPTIFKTLSKRFRVYSRKVYFNLARKLGLEH
jgi:hypothetical protein